MGNALNTELIVYIPILLILCSMTFVVLIDSYIGKRNRQIMLIIIILTFSLVVRDFFDYLLDLDGTHAFARTLVAVFGYSVRPVTLLMFFYFVRANRSCRPYWVLVIINFFIHLTALFSDICFSIDAADQFHRGPLGFTSHIISGILLIYLLYLTLNEYTRVRKIETWIPIISAVLIIVSVIIDSTTYYNQPIVFLTIAMTCSIFLYYVWLHMQFVRQHENALQAEQRIQIMMSQIQPHFLYNTLATIKALCGKEPEKAVDIADKFGAYLRQNLDSLGTVGRIPFQKELEHTKLYADIDMARFDNIRVEYDIADDDFTVPPLSLQPMVENAIRHGVRIRDEGIVKVITRRLPGYHEIVIVDNGAGFDVKTLAKDGSQHIGIRNVKERIENMCGGTLNIDSKVGTGTTVTIRIPIRKEAEA